MHGCDIVFSADTAEKVKAELSRQWGQCPCDETRCPLLPRDSDIANLAPCLAEMVPATRRSEEYASSLNGG